MPVWLLAALAMLAPTAIRGGTALARFAGGRGGAAALAGGAGVAAGAIGIPGIDLFPDEMKKRRRRRRALTASDRADIAFIAGILGRPAGKDFALIIATRAK